MQKLIIAGGVGKDAELRRTQGGDAILNFPLAVDNGKDKPATWYDASIWGKRGESLEAHIKKGGKLTLIGRPTVRVHENKAYLGIMVDDLTFMGAAKREDASGARNDTPSQGSPMDDDSDIPFAPQVL
jgi:single-strand DNA-binding protein